MGGAAGTFPARPPRPSLDAKTLLDTMANERNMAKNGSSHSLVFSGVQLENWRNFVRADLRLQKRVFLVGPNASGKSNFLDVFRFLHDLVSVGGGFQEAVERRGGMSSIRALAGRSSDVLIRVDISSDGADAPAWRYELGFGQGKQRLPVIKRGSLQKRSAGLRSEA
jgi:predicted ATPase